MPSRHDMSGTTVEEIQRHFAEFAHEYAALPLYRQIAEGMSRDSLASLLLAAAPGQARPVLFFAALHELVLRRPEVPAARWYASVVGADRVPDGDPWPDVRDTVTAHRDELTATIATRTTQTNEVNRATYVAALLHLATRDLPDQPIALIELGASAGLLLGVDRFRVEVGEARCGPVESPVRCRGESRSANFPSSLRFPRVVATCGVDLAPIPLEDTAQVRWLEACLWPDRPERLERFRAAVELLRPEPPPVLEADMVDGCAMAITRALEQEPAAHVIVMTSWALTYLEPARRAQLAEVLAIAAARGTPVSWTSAEPVGCVPGIPTAADGPGTTVLGLRRWRSGREVAPERVGSAHPHGAWIDLGADVTA